MLFRIIVCLCLFFAAIFLSVGPVHAQGKVGSETSLFLTLDVSARAAGMGYSGVTTPDISSAVYNPGALGVFLLDKNFYGNIPIKNDYTTDFIKLSLLSIGVAASLDDIEPDENRRFNIGAGLSYSRFGIDYGKITMTDYNGGDYDVDPSESAQYFTLTTGIDYYLRVGAGFTLKHVASDFGTSGISFNTYDYGFYGELPLSSIFLTEKEKMSSDRIYMDLTPSAAYAEFNASGKRVKIVDNYSADQPSFKTWGYGIYSALDYHGFALVSFRYADERKLSHINAARRDIKHGYEIGLMDILFVRFGKIESPYIGRDDNTLGFGMDLGRPLTRYILPNGSFWNKIDFYFDYSSLENSDHVLLDDVRNYSAGFSYSID